MANYYWVGNGGNWSDSSKWSLTSGGAGGAGVPGAADNVFVNAASMSANSTINVDVPTTVGSIIFTSIDVQITIDNAANLTVTTTLGISTNTIYTNGVIINGNLTTGNLTLTSGTLYLGSSNVTVTGAVSVTGSTTRSISFGTGSINIVVPNVSGSATHWSGATLSGFTATGSKQVTVTFNTVSGPVTTVTSGVDHGGTTGGTLTNALNFQIASNITSNHNISINGHFLNLSVLSGVVTSTANRNIYGDLTFSSGVQTLVVSNTTTISISGTSKTITTNGVVLNFFLTIGCVNETLTLNDALTVTRTFSLTSGNLNLNGYTLSCNMFATTTTGIRRIDFNGGNITINAAITTATTLWSGGIATNFSYTGTWAVNYNVTGNFNVQIIHGTSGGAYSTAYPSLSHTNLNIEGALRIQGHFIDVDLSGFTNQVITDNHTIYKDLKYSSTSTLTPSVAAGVPSTLTLSGNQHNKSITSNGNVIKNHIVMNATGSTLILNDALTMPYGYATFSLRDGTFDANGFNVTINGFNLGTTAGSKALNMGSGTWTLMGNNSLIPSVVAWDVETNKANPSFSFNKGTASITLLSTVASHSFLFNGGGLQYNDLLFAGDHTTTITMNQSNTFNKISSTKTTPYTFQLQATYATTVNQWEVNGSSTGQATVKSNTLAGAEHTLIQPSGTVSVSYATIKDIDATGGATWNAYTSNGNVDDGNNTGWIFTAPIIENSNTGGFFLFF